MLFQNRIDQTEHQLFNISTTIEDLQRQIDQLRTDKLNLETYLQQLGSAENAAESAINQVSTAISMIEAISPDQLVTFKEAIDALFSSDVPILASASPDPEPQADGFFPDDDDTETIDTVIVEPTLEDFIDADAPTISQVLKDEYNQTATNGHPNWLKRLSVAKLRAIAKQNGVDDQGNKATLVLRLTTLGIQEADVIGTPLPH
jgi:hypothetical protein